jgi:hypothetical protein
MPGSTRSLYAHARVGFEIHKICGARSSRFMTNRHESDRVAVGLDSIYPPIRVRSAMGVAIADAFLKR